MSRLTILGAGSWGLTLAHLSADNLTQGVGPFDSVALWDRTPEKLAKMAAQRHVTFPVDVTLPEALTLEPDLNTAIQGAEVLLLVVTSAGTRGVLEQLIACPHFNRRMTLVNASKGIEFSTLQPLSAVFASLCPDNPFAVLSGPTLAKEILDGRPTAAVVAASNGELAESLQLALTVENRMRLYSHTDVLGVELGGALKNVFAIASGYMQARQLGDNARASLITRGLAEMTRFAVTLGAQESTLYGLSGLGDLLATCNSPLSRNYQVGFRLAHGEQLSDILADMRVVAEGVQTAHAVSRLSDRLGEDMPVVQQVAQALQGGFSEAAMIRSLMSRKLKAEHPVALAPGSAASP